LASAITEQPCAVLDATTVDPVSDHGARRRDGGQRGPAEPNGKRFVGSAIWRTESVTPAPGQPHELAVRADIEGPSASW